MEQWVFNLISFSHFALQDGSQLGRTLLSSASQDCSGTSLDLISRRISHYTQRKKLQKTIFFTKTDGLRLPGKLNSIPYFPLKMNRPPSLGAASQVATEKLLYVQHLQLELSMMVSFTFKKNNKDSVLKIQSNSPVGGKKELLCEGRCRSPSAVRWCCGSQESAS